MKVLRSTVVKQSAQPTIFRLKVAGSVQFTSLDGGSFLPYPEMIIFVLKDFSAGHFCQIAWPVTLCLVHFNNNNSNKTLQDVLSSLSGRISSSAKV